MLQNVACLADLSVGHGMTLQDAPRGRFRPKDFPSRHLSRGFGRLTRFLRATAEVPGIVVVAHTLEFRHLARSQVTKRDHVVEIGSSLGLCTKILAQASGAVVGFDVSAAHLEESRRTFPELRFEFLDIFEEAERFRGPSLPCGFL